MPFDKYMQLAQEMAAKRTKQRNNSGTRAIAAEEQNIISHASKQIMYDKIVLSSDSKHMTEPGFNYTKNASFPFKFVVNNDDVSEGHGKPKWFKDRDKMMTWQTKIV